MAGRYDPECEKVVGSVKRYRKRKREAKDRRTGKGGTMAEERTGRKAGKNSTGKLWFVLGALGVLAMGIPYLFLGKDAVFVYHDQLDGEVIAYLLQARHLWEKSSILPEFMNGAAKTALTMPAPAAVLWFLFLPAEAALACMQVWGSLTGYVGMFLLLRWVGARSESLRQRRGAAAFLAMLVSGMYAYLPFLPVYGLSQYGLPLLLYCVLQLGEKKNRGGLAYLYIAVFGGNSSLVLVGFAVLGVWAVWELITIVRRRFCVRQGIAWLLLFAVYAAENGALLEELFGRGSSMISHKAEYALYPVNFWEQLWTNLTQGGQHSVDYHGWIFGVLLLAVVSLLLGQWKDRKVACEKAWKAVALHGNNRELRTLAVSCVCLLVFAAAAALWDSAVGVGIRSGLGALKGFQANRVLWLSPCLWYLILGCGLLILLENSDKNADKTRSTKIQKVVVSGMLLLAFVATMLTAATILLESNLKPNAQKLVNREYAAMSFRDYYAIGVLDQVQQYLLETYGEKPEDYRVVSLGIDPAAALYHGFYCQDGYSNNYDLNYKHRFRKIIAPELEKSEYLADQFDHWGNRCYLFSAECPGYYTIQKGGFYFQNYEIDAESLAQLGAHYLLSAAYIDHSEDTGLELMRQEPFETSDSYYRIYLYRVTEK